MPSPSDNIVLQYLADMRSLKATGATTAETSFYPPLATLFNHIGDKLKPKVVFSTQVSSIASKKQPDGGFFPVIKTSKTTGPLLGQRPERGVVEIKPAGDSLAALAHSNQVLGYLRDFGLVLITNYHQFCLVRLNISGTPEVFETYDLALTADAFWHDPLHQLVEQHKQTLPDYLARVLLYQVPIDKPKDLAWLLASYAREARARAATHPLAAFDGVKSALQESLGITFEGDKGEHFFLSTLIQTLFYGTFSAWVLFKRSPEGRPLGAVFNWRLSSDYLRIPVLRTLFHAVSERGALNTVQIIEILDLACDALNRVQPGFFATFREEDAVNYFYEPFLEAFDPELRKQLGVWYTPREIVRYMVERVDYLLRTELNEPLGLASTNVQVLDPCCGTGAYLVEVLHNIKRTLAEVHGDDTQYIGSDLRTAATTRIFGFEIMPAPFVIAHLQIANLLEDAGASLTEAQRAQVFLTNALTGWVPVKHPQSRFGYNAFTEERDAAEAVKQADTILVILGNPPYNGYAGIAQIEEERDLTTAYRTAVPGLPAPQGQGLNDLYVRFFRIAERRVVGDSHARGNKEGRGLISFISNNAWLDGLSHVSMRAKLLQEFPSIYIDNLNGDKYRTGKTTPDGKPDPSAFSTPQNREGIQVGTAITTLVRSPSMSPITPVISTEAPLNSVISTGAGLYPRSGETPVLSAAHATASSIHLRDIWGTTKLSHLDRESRREAKPSYDHLRPKPSLGLPFLQRIHSTEYTTWPRITDLLPISFPGVKTSRDSVVTSIDRDELASRMTKYHDESVASEEVERLMPGSMEDGYMYAATSIRKTLIGRGFRQWQIRPFTYRPFDRRWIYWEPTTDLLRRKVADYMEQLTEGNIWIEARQRESGDSFSRGTVVEGFADNFGNGYSSFFPLHVLEPEGIINASTTEFNRSWAADSYIGQLNRDKQVSTSEGRSQFEQGRFIAFVLPSHLFFHTLAMMHTPQYRTENSGALLGDWPHIPLPATADLLTHSATLGRRLAELLDPESSINLAVEWSFLAKLRIPHELPEGTPDRDRRNAHRLALTAGWGGAGQGATVMPRRGDARERDYTPTELERLTTLAATQSLSLDEALTLLGTRCVDTYLNRALSPDESDALWSTVPLKVWEYTLGGYQVLKKWLSYRELPLLGRPLHEDEARYFAQVVRRITAILLMGPALDASYAAILPTATGLPT